jgi:hypothetical protein
VAGATIAIAVTGCGPSASITAVRSPSPVALVSHTPSAGPSATSSAARRNYAFQAGVIVYADGNDLALLPNTQRLLDHLVTVKVNSVALAFPLYQSSWTSTDVHADARMTPSDSFLRAFIREAHQRDLAVLMRPLIDDTPLMKSGHWRGALRPTDSAAWFASYRAMIVRYAGIAQAEGAEVLDVGTELSSLQTNTAAWLGLLAAVRSAYSGRLTYSSNWDVVYPAFGSALDFASVDAFFPLSAPNGASVPQLVRAWAQWTASLSRIHSVLGKPVVLTELGTTSETGSYRSPFNWQHGTGVSLEAQRRYYTASCQALKPLVGGMYWWVYYTNWFDRLVPASDPGYQPMGKPAEQEITTCYQ